MTHEEQEAQNVRLMVMVALAHGSLGGGIKVGANAATHSLQDVEVDVRNGTLRRIADALIEASK